MKWLLLLTFMLLLVTPALAAERGKTALVITNEDAAMIKEITSLDDCKVFLEEKYDAEDDQMKAACLRLNGELRTTAAMPKPTLFANTDIVSLQAHERKRLALIAPEADDDYDDEEKKKLALLGRERVRKLLSAESHDRAAIAMKLKAYSLKEVNGNFYKQRVLSEEQKEAWKEKLEAARNRYQSARESHQAEIGSFNQLRLQEKECSGDCDEAKGKSMDAAKNALLRLGDMMLETLERIHDRIAGSEELSEASVEESLANIEDMKEFVKIKMEKIEMSTTKEELKMQGKELIDMWKQINNRLRMHEAKLIKGHVHGIIMRADNLEAKLDRLIAYMEDNDMDSSSIEEKVEQFSKHVDEAREKEKEASKLLAEAWDLRHAISTTASDNSDVKELVDKAKGLVEEAKKELQAAHEILSVIINEVRGDGIDITEATEVEEEHVVVEENDDTLCATEGCEAEALVQ